MGKMTLEELLNKLLERGWEPFGWKDIKRVNNEGWFVSFVHKSKKRPWLSEASHRELTGIESGLWQFVCENKLYKYNFEGIYVNDEWAKNVYYEISQFDEECDIIDTAAMKGEAFRGIHEPEFWIIESALCDEDKLEQFLLDNIKIEGKTD